MGFLVIALVVLAIFLMQQAATGHHAKKELLARKHFGMSLESFKMHAGVPEVEVYTVLSTPKLRAEVKARLKEQWG